MTGSEIAITADLVRDLLRDQHPDLAGLAIREVPGGWGNQMWRLGDDLAVRMQRMDPTPEFQLKERRWLPVLAPRLPLPVPAPVRSGEPSARFPKHWTVMTWVPGEPLDHGTISRGTHAADTLADFLRALHLPAPAAAPVVTDRGGHPRDCTAGFEKFLQAVALDDLAADVRAVWEDAAAAGAWEGPPVWVHGDLHPANVVVSDGTLSGIVDFGDLFAGDPACARAGRDEEPFPDPHGTERRSRPSRRQAALGARGPGGAGPGAEGRLRSAAGRFRRATALRQLLPRPGPHPALCPLWINRRHRTRRELPRRRAARSCWLPDRDGWGRAQAW